MADDPLGLRVSDAEREAVVVRLQRAAGEGRLTVEELGDRVGLAYAAQTEAELTTVTADLPASTAACPQEPHLTTSPATGSAPSAAPARPTSSRTKVTD